MAHIILTKIFLYKFNVYNKSSIFKFKKTHEQC